MAELLLDAEGDAHIEGVYAPTTNYGGALVVVAGVAYAGGEKAFNWRGWGVFNVASLAGATINAAQLERHISNAGYASGAASHLSRCTRPTTVVENEMTWEEFAASQAWTAVGGDYDDAGDPPNGVPAKVDYTEASATGTHTITGLAMFVTDALARRSSKVAMIFRLADEAPGASEWVNWRSREWTTAAERWKLRIDYTPAPSAGDRMRGRW